MKKSIVAIIVAVSSVAILVYAEYNPAKHAVFVANASNLAHQFQDSRIACDQLIEQWFTESISSDPDFIDHPSGISTAEMTAMITYCQDFVDFNENVAVAASQRRSTLITFVGTTVRAP